MRKASWWKKSYDAGLGSSEFGLGNQDKIQEHKAHWKMSELIRGKGWGLSDDTNGKNEGERSKRKIPPVEYGDSSPDDLSWSQSSDDAFWDATSRSLDEDQHQDAGVRTAALDEAGLGWSQQSDDTFWERTESSKDAPIDPEEAARERLFSSKIDGKPVHDHRTWSTREQRTWITREQLASRPEPLPYIDYKVWLPKAIEERDADKVARCVYVAQQSLDDDFIKSISEATFTEILLVLEPRQNIQELSEAYMETSEYIAKQIGLMRVNKLMQQYGILLQEMAIIRRESGQLLTPEQYLIILRSAKDLGDSRLAKKVWNDLQRDGVVPDVEMYNAYLGSFVWAGYNNSTARHQERVINHNMLAREQKRRDMPFANYHIGSPGGIKEKTMEVLTAMLNDGLTATEETYRSIITAAAREGEIDTVKSVLRTAWDIDVDGVMELNPGDPEMPKPKALPEDSQQYPTSKLLWTLAHAFGINNDIPTALRLVDYVSREYDLFIDADSWSVLFEWTFILASPRSGTNARDDRKTGQLPKASVQTLFETMTNAPYFVEPTMGMYNHLIASMHRREASTKMPDIMEKAALLHAESRNARNSAWHHLKLCQWKQEKGKSHSPISVARRRYEAAAVTSARNRLWMKRWVRLFLASLDDWHRRNLDEDQMYVESHGFTLGSVPRMLWDWREFAGAQVVYDLPTGVLEIQMQAEEDKLQAAMAREEIWYAREEAFAKADLLVGDSLILSYEGSSEAGELPGATTKRLKAARRAAVDGKNYAMQRWLGMEQEDDGADGSPEEGMSSPLPA